MFRSFLGGPRDGEHENADSLPDRLQATDDQGKAMMYEKKSEFMEGIGTRPMFPVGAVYVPVSMTQDEFLKKLKGYVQPHHLR